MLTLRTDSRETVRPEFPANVKISNYLVVVGGLVDRLLQDCWIVYSTRTAKTLIVSEDIWNRVTRSNWSEVNVEDLSVLVDAEVLVPSGEDELDVVLSQNSAAARDADVLYLVVQPTRSCQLGCGYCGQEHTKARMTATMADRALSHARAKLSAEGATYKRLQVCWFGAEPILGLVAIRQLTRNFRALETEFGIRYQAKVVTNGLALTPEIATELVRDLSVDHIEVTLDGLSGSHNVRRQTKSGRPTFERIYGNLKEVCSLDLPLEISVRCNTDGANRISALALIRQLAKDGLATKLRFYVAPVHSWGNDAHLTAMSAEEFAGFELDVLDELVANKFKVAYLPPRRPIVCMAARPDSALFDADGGTYNCTEVSYVPKYGQPNIYMGSSNGVLSPPAASLARFGEKVKSGDYDCSSCRMLPVCGGSCPKQWGEGLVPCPPTKFNIVGRLLRANADRVSPAESWS